VDKEVVRDVPTCASEEFGITDIEDRHEHGQSPATIPSTNHVTQALLVGDDEVLGGRRVTVIAKDLQVATAKPPLDLSLVTDDLDLRLRQDGPVDLQCSAGLERMETEPTIQFDHIAARGKISEVVAGLLQDCPD
jgi:hypothetical protein